MRPLLLLAAAAALACSGGSGSEDPLVAAGRSVYMSNCVVCHASDPMREGAVGPAVAGSSRALLEARLLRGEYPPGYTPKRDSQAMAAMPYLEEDIDALTAFLQAAAE